MDWLTLDWLMKNLNGCGHSFDWMCNSIFFPVLLGWQLKQDEKKNN